MYDIKRFHHALSKTKNALLKPIGSVEFHVSFLKVIAARKLEMESHPGETVERHDLLQKLISMYEEAGLSISNKDLFHQIFTFMIAGHETTSLSMTWFIFLLAKYHHYQPRLRKEVMEAMDGGSEITFDSLDKLRSLDNFIKETMRLYPVALVAGRQARNEDKIGPYTIPSGTRFFINIACLHRNKDYWTHPDEFNPDRFDVQGTKHCHYLLRLIISYYCAGDVAMARDVTLLNFGGCQRFLCEAF